MKKLIVSVAIIVALLGIFVVADCKEFSPDDDVLTVQRQKEDNNAETKDTKVAVETKAESRPVPMAVPVLTPEEAIRANREAIRLQRNKEIAKSFQSFIQKIGLNNNRIHFVLSLLPLLLIADVLFFKRKKKSSSKITEYFSLPRRIRILLSVSLLLFGILVFVPWSVYFGNSLQIPFIFQDFVNWNLRVLTITIIGICIVLLLIPPMICDYLVATIAGLGLCVYVQAMFMNQYLGTMNGVEPAWSEHRFFGTINLIIWIAIVLFPVVLRKVAPSYFSKTISIATGVVLFLEITATVSMIASAEQNVWSRKEDMYFADGSEQFQLSKKKNIIVFIFDTLGSGFMKECFDKYPETKEIVKDFIWYEDARSNYTSTFLGVCHELTGTNFTTPAKNLDDIFETMWNSPSAKSFYKQVSDAGYDTRLYCSSEYVIGSEDIFHEYFSNIKPRHITYKINYKVLHSCLRQMSSFSFAPYFAKKYFFYSFDSDDVVQQKVAGFSSVSTIPKSNNVFLEKMTSSISFNANMPVLSFYYLRGCHPPFQYDENCNRTSVPFDEPTPTTRSCFYILSKFIGFLKEANVYDDTAILVCSDHGGSGYNKLQTLYDMGFMIKPFHKTQTELSIDNSKVQSLDILPTLLAFACGDSADFKDFEGYPTSHVPNDRIRKVFYFTSDSNLPSPGPEIHKTYPGMTGFEEYNFVDISSFKRGTKSEFFVRLIPFIAPNKNNE